MDNPYKVGDIVSTTCPRTGCKGSISGFVAGVLYDPPRVQFAPSGRCPACNGRPTDLLLPTEAITPPAKTD